MPVRTNARRQSISTTSSPPGFMRTETSSSGLPRHMDSYEPFPFRRPRLGRVQSLELLRVVSGAKPTCRLRMERALLPDLLNLASHYHLSLAVGFDDILPAQMTSRGGYSEWCGRRPAQQSTERLAFACGRAHQSA